MMICRNIVTAIAIAAVCVIGTASVVTGHDQLEVTTGAILALTGLTQIPRKGDPNGVVPPQTLIPPTQ